MSELLLDLMQGWLELQPERELRERLRQAQPFEKGGHIPQSRKDLVDEFRSLPIRRYRHASLVNGLYAGRSGDRS